MAGLGVGVLTGAARAGQGLTADNLGLAASLLVLGVLAQHFLLEVAPRHKIDMSLAADFAALLLFSPPAAVVLVGLAQALGQATLALRRHPATGRRRRGLRGILFNTGQLVLASGLGALVYAGVGLPEPLAIPASALALYLANYFAVQAMLWLQAGSSGRAVGAELVRQAPEFAALCLVGLVTAIASRQTALAPLLMALPTAGLYLVQRQTIQTMARERCARTEAEATERKAAMLAEQNTRILAAVREAILKTDVEGRIEFANPTASQLIGSLSEELVGRRPDAVLSVTDGEHAVGNRCDGRQVPIEYTAARVADGDVVVVRDISLRLEAERNRELLARAEKLRALGQMASGVAHDLNQSLALISGYAYMAREGLEERLLSPEGPAAHLDVIVSAAHDGAKTVRRLLAWTRTSRPAEGTLVDLEQLLPEVAHLTAPRGRDATQAEGHPIELRVEVSGPAMIEGNSASLREALTNLVFNAVDAMPAGGSITLRARRRGASTALADVPRGRRRRIDVELASPAPGPAPTLSRTLQERVSARARRAPPAVPPLGDRARSSRLGPVASRGARQPGTPVRQPGQWHPGRSRRRRGRADAALVQRPDRGPHPPRQVAEALAAAIAARAPGLGEASHALRAAAIQALIWVHVSGRGLWFWGGLTLLAWLWRACHCWLPGWQRH